MGRCLLAPLALALPFSFLLGGCANTNPPTPVVAIPEFNAAPDDPAKNQDKAALSQTADPKKNSYNISASLQAYAPLPPENDIEQIKSQLKLYSATWYQQSALNTAYGNDLSHLQFWSAAIGGVSALTKSPQGATIGAGVAGLSGLVSSHYALSVQSTNYSKGADAMQCLYDEISDISPAAWGKLYDPSTGAFLFTRSEVAMALTQPSAPTANNKKTAQGQQTQQSQQNQQSQQSSAMAGYETLITMIPEIRKDIDAILVNVRNAQQNVILATPSSADIQNAIGKGVSASATANAASQPLSAALVKPGDKKQANTLTAQLQKQQTELTTYTSKRAALVAQTEFNNALIDANTKSQSKLAADIQSQPQTTSALSPMAISSNVAIKKRDVLKAEATRHDAEGASLKSQMEDNEANIEKSNSDIAQTQEALDKVAPIDTDQINLLLQLPASMTKCVTLTGSAPTSGKSTTTAQASNGAGADNGGGAPDNDPAPKPAAKPAKKPKAPAAAPAPAAPAASAPAASDPNMPDSKKQ